MRLLVMENKAAAFRPTGFDSQVRVTVAPAVLTVAARTAGITVKRPLSSVRFQQGQSNFATRR
jgi:hypothetical protein